MFFGDWLYRRELLSPDKIALIDAEHGNLEITYQLWNHRVNRMANFFQQALGIGNGDRICIYSLNRMEYLDTIFACNKLGAILQVINWRLTAGEIGRLITDFEPKVLMYGPEWTAQVEQIWQRVKPEPKLICLGQPQRTGDISWLEEAGRWPETQPEPVELDWEDPWIICYTGGTTGLPKGAILNYRSLTWNSINTVVSWGLRPDDIVPHYMPMFHTGGINVMMQPIVYVGGTTILCKGFDVDRIFNQIEGLGITFFFGVPVMLLAMIQHPRWESLDLSRVRLVMAGGGNCPRVVYEAFWKKGVEFKEGYGLTEAGPNTFWLPNEVAKNKIGSVGRPLFHVDVKIVNDSGNLLGANQVGELMVRGPHVFGGYWKNPMATEAVLEDGWLHTGDLSSMDEDYCYFIVVRLKNMIKSWGENIYPAEIEDILHSHPEILEGTVIPMPDPKWGEVGCAVVVLR
ncbi:MAG: long-chain fatty acid--CoA ligase, partial [Anaerolineae bacterium]|nr:long-chain fatty acid--CoA ligase [Anaerolineae bacterium]